MANPPVIGVIPMGQRTGRPVQVLASDEAHWLGIGQQIAWDLINVNASGTDVVLFDGSHILPGDAGIEFGNIWCKIRSGPLLDMWAPYSAVDLVITPVAGPTAVEGGAGVLGAGAYKLAYSYVNTAGQTSGSPQTTVNIGATKQIDVAAIAIPQGAQSVNWYLSDAAGSNTLRLLTNKTTGAAFSINALPANNAAVVPNTNTTRPEGLNVLERNLCGINNRSVFRSDFDVLKGFLNGGMTWKPRIKAGGAGQPSWADLLAAMPALYFMPNQ